MLRYSSLFEAFSTKDMDRAIEILKNQIEKRVFVKLVKLGKPVMRKLRGKEIYGLSYEVKGLSDFYRKIRFNWQERTGNKIVSVDVFVGKGNKNIVNIDVTAKNSLQIINELSAVINEVRLKYTRKKRKPVDPRRSAKASDIADMKIGEASGVIISNIDDGELDYFDFIEDPKTHIDMKLLKTPFLIKAVIKRVKDYFEDDLKSMSGGYEMYDPYNDRNRR